MNYDPRGDETNIGALAEGFANSAISSTEVSDDSTGYVGVANGNNRDNVDSSLNVDVNATLDVDANNGNNRENAYSWDYDSNSVTNNTSTSTAVTDTDTQVQTVSDSFNTASYELNYDARSYTDDHTTNLSYTNVDTDISNTTNTETTTLNTAISDSFNTVSTDTDFSVISAVSDFDNLGVAGRDLTFNIGDDYSFSLDVDGMLAGSPGDGIFSAVQANHLVDQDVAYNITMNNQEAQNDLSADAGSAYGDPGLKGWDLGAGDDVSGSSVADASAILANSGYHLQLVQGANLLTNQIDSSFVGGDHYVTNVGEDASGSGS
ncbi:fibrinogen-binding protein [Shinella sp.]|uniref:fibrinogen-binding protein n=1 Tax=Shinella sp. TaxID=1870904 RepID=UPI00301C9745